ncbi:MAG TPA: DUF4388 domain-containing protein [Thermomicrobiaceae bacterium]|nr:DUF4388 domain-containing protein [Thermomicrobiaceae bacterium]
MGFYGDLEDLPLQDILYVLSTRAKSGQLTLKTGEQEFILMLDRGRIAAVTTNDDSLRIGRLLVDQGYVTEEQMEQALALQKVGERPVRIGDVLVQLGFVSRKEIGQAVAAQLEASLFRVLLHPSGAFAFTHDGAIRADPLMEEISIEAMILNAVRRADEWIAAQAAEERVALPNTPFDPAELDELGDLERRALIAVLNGASTVRAIIKATGLPAPELWGAVRGLLEAGLLDSVDDETGGQPVEPARSVA